ncbi:diguanylate cyclase [Conexibacter sp. JD483]|uniref:diguanylate cyclase n=1 Tax=unclassified Conexibacter TaxID=2627773 RepID=UPI0027203818|nr:MULTISPECIES: diguanylate cyclase [unclassified Conexibacter]MDO8186478.1 diguanylate cyclase [Conexibacter sp. CPCC 205706]MDO8200047.1 diguanylate cyclase [Conexibacter sp. CPCC 205762]MDR9370877.1 diguanylate cyclase [Conexibacter sp. JD483]
MSFRTRLAVFFVLLVVVPMVALGVVVARLVTDSEKGKADARAGAHVTSALAVYERASEQGGLHARRLGADPVLSDAIREGDRQLARTRLRTLTRQQGLERVVIERAGRGGASGGAGAGAGSGAAGRQPFVALGNPTAVAAGEATVRGGAGADAARLAVIEASTISAADLVRLVASPGVEAAVRRGDRTLASSLPAAAGDLPRRGRIALDGTEYVAAGFSAEDFGGSRDEISVLTDAGGSNAAVARNRRLAFALLGGFLLLAFAGALVVSRQLQGQIGRFLAAAKRVGGGDFSTAVPTEGSDEFAQLGDEFNKMSHELEQRIGELDRERARLRESIQRVGETFASNLDRRALLELGAETIADAVEASAGRASAVGSEPVRIGEVEALAPALDAAEARARAAGAPAQAQAGQTHALACPIPRSRDGAEPHGTVAVARRDRAFDEEELALVGSLAAQTGISLENVELHDQVARQAVTDELTGLFNHRRFQEVMAAEVAAAARFGQPLGLLLLDIDDFKKVNDTYGHQQGDLVLKAVAAALRENSREIDEPARYGGEEMAVALPQTDLDGAYTIAERVRESVAALVVPALDGGEPLRVTVSIGVAASASAGKDALVAAADAALYVAKRSGKNRTERAPVADPAAAERE